MEYQTKSALLADLRARVYAQHTQRAVAKSLGVSDSFLNDVLHGRRDITENLARAMGYIRIVHFLCAPQKGRR